MVGLIYYDAMRMVRLSSSNELRKAMLTCYCFKTLVLINMNSRVLRQLVKRVDEGGTVELGMLLGFSHRDVGRGYVGEFEEDDWRGGFPSLSIKWEC